MNFSDAIEWVRNNEGLIKKTLGKYYIYSPYEEEDYMQDAFESAMVAVLKSQGKQVSFESAFWQDFRKSLSLVTPNMSTSRYGSNSVPSYLCLGEIDVAAIAQQETPPELDMEAIFWKIQRHLTERERAVFSLALGLTGKGKLTSYEIGKYLRCSPANARGAFCNALDRIRRLVNEGVIDPGRLRRQAALSTSNSTGG